MNDSKDNWKNRVMDNEKSLSHSEMPSSEIRSLRVGTLQLYDD